MTIKDQVAALMKETDKTMKELDRPQLIAKIVQLSADLQDEKNEVPVEVFAAMTPEIRRTALVGMLSILASQLA